MKLTYEQKVQIYHDWKSNRMSATELAEHYHIALSNIQYLVELADRHGVSALEHKYTSYTSEFKLNAIYRVLKSHESAYSVSLDLRLSAKGTLPRWVKEYVSNGYNIVEKKKGRKPNGSQTQEDCRGTREGESGSAETKQGTSPEERDSFDTDRILKKIRCLGFGKREIRKEEIAQAVTELRQETRRSLRFILNAIAGDASLPQLPRSDYYYYMNHQDPDKKHDNLMNAIRQIYYDNHGKVNHDRMITEILNDPNLTTADKMKKYDHEQKQYQRRQKANAKVNGRMQDKQTKNTVLATIGWCVVFFCVGGTVVAFCPAARTFVTSSMKQIGKAAATAA